MTEGSADLIKPERVHVTPSSNEVVPPPRAREEIKVELNAVNAGTSELNPEYERIGDLVRSLPKEESGQIDELITKVAQGVLTLEDATSAYTGQRKAEFDQAVAFAQKVNSKQVEIDKLEEEYRPHREEDLITTVEQLSARVNFDQIMWHIDARHKDDHSGAELFRRLAQLRIVEVAIKNRKLPDSYHYSDLDHLQDVFNDLSKELAEKALLRSPDDERVKAYKTRPETGAEVATARKEVIEEASLVVEQLHEFARLTRIYRPREDSVNGYSYHVDPGLQQLVELLDIEKNRRYNDERKLEVDYDPRLIEAAKAYVAKKKFGFQISGRISQSDETRDIYYSQFHEYDPFAALAKTEFKGFEADPPEGKKRFMTKDAVVRRLAGYIPAGFLTRILSVEQSPAPKMVDETHQVSGEHETIYDENGNVVGSRIYMNKTPFIESEAAPMDEFGEIASYEQTLSHEIGHCVHSWLSYDEMKAWEDVLSSDRPDMGFYIASLRAVNPRRAKYEEFAETFGMFSASMPVLRILSEKRFTYMYTLYRNRIHPQVREQYDNWVSNYLKLSDAMYASQGITSDSIKETYKRTSDLSVEDKSVESKM